MVWSRVATRLRVLSVFSRDCVRVLLVRHPMLARGLRAGLECWHSQGPGTDSYFPWPQYALSIEVEKVFFVGLSRLVLTNALP